MNKILFLIFVTFALSGCANLISEPTGKILTQYATIKFINESDNFNERAEKVSEIAIAGQEFFDNRALPITDIEQLIRERIDFELDYADQLLLNGLIEQIKMSIDRGIDERSIDEDVRVTGSKVLGWVNDAALLVMGR